MLPRPLKTILVEPSADAPVVRGWLQVQRKRQVRAGVRRGALAALSLLLAVSVGFALRPVVWPASVVAVTPVPKAVVTAGPLDQVMQQLPRVQARSVAVQRPAPTAASPQQLTIPEPDLDVVGALLDSVRDAYEAGNWARAQALLTEIGAKHERDPRAAQALYVLGLIHLERSGDPTKAASSFTRALELSPPPDLVPVIWEALQRATSEGAARPPSSP